jgi:anti-anti-sigma factor
MHALPPSSATDPSTARLRALTYDAGDAAVIVVEGWLDGGSMPALDRALTDALARGRRDVVLDLHQLRSVEPDGLAVLWAGLRATLRRGGTLATAGLRPSLQGAVDPLVAHGLRLHGTVGSAVSTAQRMEARPR